MRGRCTDIETDCSSVRVSERVDFWVKIAIYWARLGVFFLPVSDLNFSAITRLTNIIFCMHVILM